MNFKEDRKYKIGRTIFATATTIVAISAALMFFGVDIAIVPFFLGCFVMIGGNSIMVSVKYKYQQASEDAPSIGQRIAWRFEDFKEFFKKKGVLGSALFVTLLIAIGVTSVFGYRAWSTAYDYNGNLNGGYKYNLKLHEESLNNAAIARAESEEAFQKGDFAVASRKDKEADRLEFQAETYLIESGEYYKTAVKLKPIKEQRMKTFKKVLAVTVWVPVLFVLELIVRNFKKRKKN